MSAHHTQTHMNHWMARVYFLLGHTSMSIVDCKERGLVVQLRNNAVGILQCEETMTELNTVSHYQYRCTISTTEVSNVRLTWNRKLTYILTRTRIIAGYIGHIQVLERTTPTTLANVPTVVT